mgnify:FL=1
MRSLFRIITTARELWPLYLGIVLGAIVTAATALLMPFAIARATDTVVAMVAGTGGSIATLVWLATALLALSLANSAISNLTGYWGDVMATRLRAILSRRYFEKLLRLPQRYFDNELTGTIISRLNRSITSITDFLNMFANSFFPTLITLGAVLVITLFYSPWLALLLVERGDHDEVAARKLGVRTQRGDQGGAVNARQQHVHDQHLGLYLPVQRQTGDAIVCHLQLHTRKVLLHDEADQVLEMDRVFNQQDLRRAPFGGGHGRCQRGAAGHRRAGCGCRGRAPGAVGGHPAFHRCAGDTAMSARRLPGLQLVAVHHQLDGPYGHAQHLGDFERCVVVGHGALREGIVRLHRSRIFPQFLLFPRF